MIFFQWVQNLGTPLYDMAVSFVYLLAAAVPPSPPLEETSSSDEPIGASQLILAPPKTASTISVLRNVYEVASTSRKRAAVAAPPVPVVNHPSAAGMGVVLVMFGHFKSVSFFSFHIRASLFFTSVTEPSFNLVAASSVSARRAKPAPQGPRITRSRPNGEAVRSKLWLGVLILLNFPK